MSLQYNVFAVFTYFVARVPEKPEMDNVAFDLVNWVQGWKPSNQIGVKMLHLKKFFPRRCYMLLLLIVIIFGASITSTFPFFFP